jgi:hypothetical protein
MNPSTLKITFNVAALIVALALAVGLCFTRSSDGDVWAHVGAGEQLVGRGSFPDADPALADAGQPAPFSRQTWLFALAAFGLYQAGEGQALQVFRACCLVLAFGFCVATAFRRGSRPFSAALATLAALWASRPWLGNHLFDLNLLFFSAVLFLLEGPFWEAFFSRWMWLPLVAVPWVNVSPLAVILPFLLALWLAAEDPESDLRPGNPGLAKWLYLGALVFCLLLNPEGYRIFGRFFHAPSSLPPAQGFRSALAPENFQPAQPALLFMAAVPTLVIASGWLAAGRQALSRDVLLFVLLAGLGLGRARFLPLYCLWAAPVVASRLGVIVDVLPAWLQSARWAGKVMVLGLGLVLLPRTFLAPEFGLSVETSSFPRQTLDFLKDQDIEGLILPDARWGGWLAWNLKGHNPVMVDGRLEDGQVWQAYRDVLRTRPDWKKVLEQSGVQAVLAAPGSPLALALGFARDWQPVAFDDAAVLFVRDDPSHAALIRTYAPRGLRPGDPSQPFDPSRLEQAEADLETLLARYPEMGRLYLYRAALARTEGQAARALESLEKGRQQDPEFFRGR